MVARRRSQGNRSSRLAGLVSQGAAIVASEEHVVLPADRIGPGEQVFRVHEDLLDFGLAAGDLLIVEPRQHAATGEFVIATLGERAFVGRWWTKHGSRKLLDHEFCTIADAPELMVLGAVTLIVRVETR